MDNIVFPNIFTFAKDKRGKFIFCNENLAKSAGLDSPRQIVGKSDMDLCWKDRSNFYGKVDSAIINKTMPYINILEKQTQTEKSEDILITKSQLLDKNGNCIGVVGSYINITGYVLVKKQGYFDKITGKFYLGKKFSNEYFTNRELSIFKYLMLGYTSKKIGLCLNISYRTVEIYVETIKYKLQCKTKGDIIVTAVKAGLTYLIFDKIMNDLEVIHIDSI